MEKQFFTWEEWDQIDDLSFLFFNVKLVAPIGKYRAGTKFSSASLSYETGVLQFFNDPETKPIAEFKLGLVVIG